MFKLKAPSILAFCSRSLNKLRLSMKPLRTSTTLAAAHTVAGVGFFRVVCPATWESQGSVESTATRRRRNIYYKFTAEEIKRNSTRPPMICNCCEANLKLAIVSEVGRTRIKIFNEFDDLAS